MSGGRMHEDELQPDAALVRRLVDAQFPQWAGLPVRPAESFGTNNAIFRLGSDLVVRLPRIEESVEQAEFEHRWLPLLARHSPVRIPVPVALGRPGEGYPWRWAVNRWIDGEVISADNADLGRLAADLGAFVAALRAADPADVRRGYRGVPLREKDAFVREWTAAATGLVDVEGVLEVWQQALDVPEWTGPLAWTHGDLLPGNLLVEGGRLTGIIDFGAAGIGDPACDAIPAWTSLTAETRDVFREAAGFDDPTWARGRGWAVTFISALTYYAKTNPYMAALGRRAIDEVLADKLIW